MNAETLNRTTQQVGHNGKPVFKGFQSILDAHGIDYHEGDVWLTVGGDAAPGGYLFFLSVRLLDIPKVLDAVLPILRSADIVYRIAKNELEASKIGNGYYGHHLGGKMIQIQPSSKEQALWLAPLLADATKGFTGMLLTGSVRLGDVLYVLHVSVPAALVTKKTLNHTFYRMFNPSGRLNQLPKKKFVGGRFLPVEVLRYSNKGNVYKAVDLRTFNWCVVKQGNAHAVDDIHGRDMRDRLLWQRHLMELLQDDIPMPRIIRYAEYPAFNFLVMEYLEGTTLEKTIEYLLAGKQWKGIEGKDRTQLLRYYLGVLDIIGQLHDHGIIHRDITPANFIVRADGGLEVIDFEMAYSMIQFLPDPPFVTGTIGYVSPEQVRCELPSPSHDVYSLGALFLHMVTGLPPKNFKGKNSPVEIAELLVGQDVNKDLASTVADCFSEQTLARPDIKTLKSAVMQVM